jgi:hypothetical protein
MLGDDILQNFYKFKYGGKEPTQFEANTFGSVFHLGVEQIFKDEPGVEVESRFSQQLPNGWTISGSIDLISHNHNHIVDWKVSTSTTIAKLIKEGRAHQYALQLGVYKWLVEQNFKDRGEEPEEYKAMIAMVDKKFSYFTIKNKYNQLNFIPIETYSSEDIYQMLIERTNLIDEYLTANETPPKCMNVFPYKPRGGTFKEMRCLYYCDYATECEYKNTSYASSSDIQTIMGL